MAVQGVATITIIDDPEVCNRMGSPLGKPFLRIEFNNKMIVDVTTNLAEMIGGAGAGVRKRQEDAARRK